MMRLTKILWLVVPVVFILAIAGALLSPGRKPQPEAKVRVIAIKADPADPADVERARKKIEETYEFLKNGADFAQVAGSKSEALSADSKGDMGWVGKGVLPKHLEDVIFKLEPGQFSEIIKDTAGESVVFRILYVEQRRNF
jgi:parvulin-like peptidyl-prolyl isomerase